MEFTVSRADLVRELNLSQGVVEKKTTIPILSNVLVEADGDKIVLTATDLELGIRVSCPARVKKSGGGTIPARRLLDYVRLLPDSDVQVKIQDNHWASLTCGRSKTRIAGMSRESFPELPKMPEVLAEIPIGVLASMISKTIFSISSEESRFTLNGALMVLPNPTTFRHRELVIRLAAKHRLPAVYPYRYFVTEGGLMSYGTDLVEQYRQAGLYVDRILRGAKPADLPVQGPTKYETVVNLRTAKALGLTVPPGLLVAADEVIE